MDDGSVIRPRQIDPKTPAFARIEVVPELPLVGSAVRRLTRFVSVQDGQETAVMIIEAGARFVCTHRYMVQVAQLGEAVADGGDRLLLVCERCGHRAEQLPLPRDNAFGRVIAFPTPMPMHRYVPTISEHEPPPLLSA